MGRKPLLLVFKSNILTSSLERFRGQCRTRFAFGPDINSLYSQDHSRPSTGKHIKVSSYLSRESHDKNHSVAIMIIFQAIEKVFNVENKKNVAVNTPLSSCLQGLLPAQQWTNQQNKILNCSAWHSVISGSVMIKNIWGQTLNGEKFWKLSCN